MAKTTFSQWTIPTIDLSFKPVTMGEYKPVVNKEIPNDNLLAQGLQDLGLRKEKAGSAYEAINTAFSEAESKLLNDPNMIDTFREQQDRIKHEINEEIAAGNYRTAFDLAKRKGSDLINSNMFKDMARYTSDYNDAKTKVDGMVSQDKLTQDDYEYWLATNGKPDYKANYDDNGNYIGSNKFDSSKLPVNSIHYDALFKRALDELSPSGSSRTSGSSSYVDGTGGASRSERSYTGISKNRLLGQVNQMFDTDSGLQRQVLQDFNSKQHKLQNIQSKLASKDLSADERANLRTEEAMLKKALYMNDQPIDGNDKSQLKRFLYYNIENSKFGTLMSWSRTTRETQSDHREVTPEDKGGSKDGVTGSVTLPNGQVINYNITEPAASQVITEGAPNAGRAGQDIADKLENAQKNK